MSISKRLKYFLTGDAGILVDAGFISPCDGKLSEDGRAAMWLILMDQNMAAFVAAAKEVIEEREKASK